MTARPVEVGGCRPGLAAVGKVFLAFAFAYFLSALLRAVTATLAPVFSAELGLSASQLGLLGGAYFLSFAMAQLPLGSALDRWGPQRVHLVLLVLAIAGCMVFSQAVNLGQLVAGRMLIGLGVSACLMAALTRFSHVLAPAAQFQANSWMLMTGSLGMLASTLPVQWLLPTVGWRGLFLALAAMLAVAFVLVARWAPDVSGRQEAGNARSRLAAGAARDSSGYGQVFRHPAFVRLAPMGFFVYGGLVAMQSLWIGPWLTQVVGKDAAGAAAGLFAVNLAMLAVFFAWGVALPALARRGWDGERLIAWGWLPGMLALAAIVWRGPEAGVAYWVVWCVCTSVVSLSQPAMGQALPAAMVGRALSAFNLVIFSGVFSVQWGIGLLLDAAAARGQPMLVSYRGAFGVFAACCLGSLVWFWFWRLAHAKSNVDR